jgi:hypothetical protein
MKFDVLNRFSGELKFTADIDCQDDALSSIKLGLAVKWALKNKADLREADLRGANLWGANLWEADLRGANLWEADLREADLRGANLWGANLWEADLRGANLREADLWEADLWEADLREADLRGANLRGANLWEADLWEADLWGANLTVLQTDIWVAYIQPEYIRIGCKYHTATAWFAFDDDTITEMSSDALSWWQKWKPVIQAIHATYGVKP